MERWREELYSDSLCHYGIKGMKWGQRRFQNSDGSLTAAGRNRYGITERLKIRARSYGEELNAAARNIRKAKGLRNKASEFMGHGRQANKARYAAKKERRLANASRTRAGKYIHNIRADNATFKQSYHERIKKMSFGARVVNSLTGDPVAYSTPVKKLSGRTTSYGKQRLDYLLTGGNIGLAKDVIYLTSGKKTFTSDRDITRYGDSLLKKNKSKR